MWSVCSFTYYLMTYQLKYLEGSIYFNCYFGICSDLLATVTGQIIYKKFGAKLTFMMAYSCSIFAAMNLFLFPNDHVEFYVFLTKYGICVAFLATYQVSYNTDMFQNKPTSIGICNFVARATTIMAPEVNEMSHPLVYLIIC